MDSGDDSFRDSVDQWEFVRKLLLDDSRSVSCAISKTSMDSGEDAPHTVPTLYEDYVFFHGSMLLSLAWLCPAVPAECPMTRSVVLLRARQRHGDTEGAFAF